MVLHELADCAVFVSPETTIAADLASLPDARGRRSTRSCARLDEMIAQRLTNDYWEITLPGDLATSASRSPSLFAYLAALNILDAPCFSRGCEQRSSSTPRSPAERSRLQRHHLFPRKYLEGLGITDLKQVNQIANLAVLEWHDNLVDLGDRSTPFTGLLSRRDAQPPSTGWRRSPRPRSNNDAASRAPGRVAETWRSKSSSPNGDG